MWKQYTQFIMHLSRQLTNCLRSEKMNYKITTVASHHADMHDREIIEVEMRMTQMQVKRSLRTTTAKRKSRHASLVIVLFFLFTLLFLLIMSILLRAAKYPSGGANSFFQSYARLHPTILFIVPHQDDEVLFGTHAISGLSNAGAEVFIAFSTNGDYRTDGSTRMREAEEAANLLGVPDDHVIFLGYSDGGDDGTKMMYNQPPDEVIRSHANRSSTYGLIDHPEFSMLQNSEHSSFTRTNKKQDLKSMIEGIMPDTLFLVDYDRHPEHRETTLLCQEALGEILSDQVTYTPDVFMGFAYNTAYFSTKDFYDIPLKSTIKPHPSKLLSAGNELDVPAYTWDERVRIPARPETLGYTLRSTLFYHALHAHASQNVEAIAESALNGDAAFWQRRTDSLSYDADILVSSGNGSRLNDFKLMDSSDIAKPNSPLDVCTWVCDENDTENSATLMLKTSTPIEMVRLFDNPSSNDNILSGTLTTSTGERIVVSALPKNGVPFDIQLQSTEPVSWLRFSIDKKEGSQAGLVEMEIYSVTVSSAPLIAKITDTAVEQNFLYHIAATGEPITLGYYLWPSQASEDGWTIRIASDPNHVARLDGRTLSFAKGNSGKCMIRLENKLFPEVFDEIVVEVPSNPLRQNGIRLLQKTERLWDKGLRFIRRLMGEEIA